MKRSKAFWNQPLPQEKLKNRSWKAALDAQFPSLMGDWNGFQKSVAALLAFVVGGLLVTLMRAGYQNHRFNQRQAQQKQLRLSMTQLDHLLQKEHRSWFSDKKVESLKWKISKIAQGSRHDLTGVTAAFYLAERALEEADLQYSKRLFFKDQKGEAGQQVEGKNRALQEALRPLPHTSEFLAYEEAMGWLQQLSEARVTTAVHDLCCKKLGRIYTALGRFSEAETSLRAIQQPIFKIMAAADLFEIMRMQGRVSEAAALARMTLQSLDKVTEGAMIHAFGLSFRVAFESLKSDWRLKLQSMESMERIAA